MAKGYYLHGTAIELTLFKPVVIPGEATGHIQVADESWNKPIKDQLREMYDQWMDEGPHTYTKEGNICRPPLKQIFQ